MILTIYKYLYALITNPLIGNNKILTCIKICYDVKNI